MKGGHILIGADGAVCLSGLRKSIFLPVQEGDKSQMAYHFPSHAVAVLPWMAPEILQQVSALVNILWSPRCEMLITPANIV